MRIVNAPEFLVERLHFHENKDLFARVESYFVIKLALCITIAKNVKILDYLAFVVSLGTLMTITEQISTHFLRLIAGKVALL